MFRSAEPCQTTSRVQLHQCLHPRRYPAIAQGKRAHSKSKLYAGSILYRERLQFIVEEHGRFGLQSTTYRLATLGDLAGRSVNDVNQTKERAGC